MEVYITDLSDVLDDSALISLYEEKMSDEDKARYQKITDSHRKLEFLVGRSLIREVCQSDVHLSENGKPLVSDGYISLAHSGHFVVLAVDGEPVGIDIEDTQKEINFEQMSKRLKFNIENPTKESFFRAFTAYEADFKLGKEGVKQHLYYSINAFIICISILNNNKNICFIKTIPFKIQKEITIPILKEDI